MNDKLTRLWKTKNKNDEWWSSFVTSPIAIAANYFVVDVKWLTPNIITALSFIVAIISVVFIVMGGLSNFIIAALLIQLSHVLDCMDGQMARYRKTSSFFGSYFDKFTDHVQVIIWFCAVGYAAYVQSQSVQPVFLAFIGVAFYSLRGYVKYVALYTEMSKDNTYLTQLAAEEAKTKSKDKAGLGFTFAQNLTWFLSEQRKFFAFDEGVFVFMLSLSLVLNTLTPMLWVFAISQFIYGLARGWDRGRKIERKGEVPIVNNRW